MGSQTVGKVRQGQVITVERSQHVRGDFGGASFEYIFVQISSPGEGWVVAWSSPLGQSIEAGNWKIKAKARPLVLTLTAQVAEVDVVEVLATSLAGEEYCS